MKKTLFFLLVSIFGLLFNFWIAKAENVKIQENYLKSSYNMLSQEQLDGVFYNYNRNKIVPIRILLERFVQDSENGKIDFDWRIAVTSDGGMWVFKNWYFYDSISEDDYFLFTKEEIANNTYTLIWKNFRYPLNIVTASRVSKWIKDPIQRELSNANSFYGILEFNKDKVINELDLEQYIQGIWESASWTHPEKMKMQSILARSYAYFYMFSGFKKFKDVDYILTDNPRNSQKYMWYNVGNGQKWQEAVKETKGLILTDELDELFIAPYSTCTLLQKDWTFRRKTLQEAGWSEEKMIKEGKIIFKFWHNVLKPVEDTIGACKEKQNGGHGVWLSWNGAEYLASKEGKKAMDIITHYYNNVKSKVIY